ncbi:MAG: RagB/SusD family nutrient uptake outer membrane protein [Prevotella sp.]|nr:RagB/SusD family nutrient uptake outer membrane protein [Prevotella sp.]
MKCNNIYKVFVMVAVALLGFSSCSDFLTIYPTDKTIAEDFWKTKSDVQEMVNGAYKSMMSYDNQERAIIWGAFRSDELVKYNDYSSSALDNINAVNLLPSNGYNSWASFYSTINRCNIVLAHAADVMEVDPSFTEGDYQAVRAQMLALRSLCYFYLVRTFRDVPYTTQSFEDDDQNMLVAQTTPDSLLQHCINDLEEAQGHILLTGGYGLHDWRNCGFFTLDAVNALLADIYLWRASMTKSQSDYQKCIEYADKVINSKDAYYKANNSDLVGGSMEKDIYHLNRGTMAYLEVFNMGNSSESILEWQYSPEDGAFNHALENAYYRSGNKDSYRTTGMLMASPIFNFYNENANTNQGQKVFGTTSDMRYWNCVYGGHNEEATQLEIRKMVSESFISSTTQTASETKSNDRSLGGAYTSYDQNWIVYRLTDIMLMKAEALVQTAASDSDKVTLEQAFNLVQYVNKRSISEDGIQKGDTLKLANFTSKDDMELLVLAERERELCFEGKRWYDLVRYCYRHMDGVNINSRLADQTSWPKLYSPMLKLIVRKYMSGGDAVSYKMKGEPFLYWPILEGEIKVNKLLKQNPVYIDEKSTSKN